jgi:hypothetical protein
MCTHRRPSGQTRAHGAAPFLIYVAAHQAMHICGEEKRMKGTGNPSLLVTTLPAPGKFKNRNEFIPRRGKTLARGLVRNFLADNNGRRCDRW